MFVCATHALSTVSACATYALSTVSARMSGLLCLCVQVHLCVCVSLTVCTVYCIYIFSYTILMFAYIHATLTSEDDTPV